MLTTPLRRARGMVPVVAVAAVALAGCGGGDDGGSADGVASLDTAVDDAASGDSAESPTTEPVDQEEALLEFAACMREHGVDMPDPTLDEDGGVRIQIGGGEPGDGQPPQVSEEAMEACRELMPEFGPRDGSDFDPTEMQDEMLEFTQCMREHGVDIDDPEFGDDGRMVVDAAPADSGPEPERAGGAVLAGPFGVLDMSDPDTQAAFDECSESGGMFGATPAGPGAADQSEASGG